MKRFIFTALGVAVFFVGLGALVENVGARFKSDQKALELIQKARQAIGGDSAIKSIQSMRIVGQTTRTVKNNGADTIVQGETEIALQLPDKLSRTVKVGRVDGSALPERSVNQEIDVIVTGEARDRVKFNIERAHGEAAGSGEVKTFVFKTADGKVTELNGAEAASLIAAQPGAEGEHIVIRRKADGSTEPLSAAEADKIVVRTREGDRTTYTLKDGSAVGKVGHTALLEHAAGGGAFHYAGTRNNEMLRLTLTLLLSAPEGMDVNYTFGGESVVDGTACNIVIAEFGGSSYKLYLNQATYLPVMVSYTSSVGPAMFRFNKEPAPGASIEKETRVFQMAAMPAPAPTEFAVKFSDYRTVNGVQLPFKWTQTVGGAADEVFDVTAFEINPPNIAEKFQNQRVLVRSKKTEGQ